jgi:hypothetical protein
MRARGALELAAYHQHPSPILTGLGTQQEQLRLECLSQFLCPRLRHEVSGAGKGHQARDLSSVPLLTPQLPWVIGQPIPRRLSSLLQVIRGTNCFSRFRAVSEPLLLKLTPLSRLSLLASLPSPPRGQSFRACATSTQSLCPFLSFPMGLGKRCPEV